VALTRDELVQVLYEYARDELLAAGDDFSPRSNLVEAGLESLGLTQLLLCVEEHTGIWLDESLLTPETLQTIETLAACVHEQLPG
jgi:acyl carrier protein